MADSKKPAKKDADSKEPAETTTPPSHSHITATRRGVATVRPTTPEARRGHGYRKPYGTAVSRAARHCSHASLDVTHDRLPYGPRAAGPFNQREAWRRPGLSQSAKSVAGLQKPATPFLEAGAPLRRQDEVRLQ